MFVYNLLFLLTPFSFCKCYRVQSPTIKKEFEKIMENYINPIKQLKANFPNHDVEIQFEYQGLLPQRPVMQNDGRKTFYVYRPPNNLRNGIMVKRRPGDDVPYTETSPITWSITTTPPPTPPPPPPTSAPSTTASVQLPIPSTEPTRTPVFKEDLEKIIRDLIQKVVNIKKGSDNYDELQSRQVYFSNIGPIQHSGNIDKLSRILERAGVKLQMNAPKGNDENIEWLQVKIPKY